MNTPGINGRNIVEITPGDFNNSEFRGNSEKERTYKHSSLEKQIIMRCRMNRACSHKLRMVCPARSKL